MIFIGNPTHQETHHDGGRDTTMRASMRLKGDVVRLVYDSEVVPNWSWVNFKDARILRQCAELQRELSTEAGHPAFIVLHRMKNEVFSFAEPRVVIEVDADGKVVDES